MKINLRNIAAYLVAKIKIISGKPNKIIEQCKNGDLILSIYTHNMSKHQLNQIIRWMKKKGISFISIEELNAMMDQNQEMPKGKSIITMDDGWNNNIDIMSFCEKLRFPICIFLTTDPIENGGGYWWSYVKKAKEMGLKVRNVDWYKKLENSEREKAIVELRKLIEIKREGLKPYMIKSHSHSDWVSFGSHTKHHPILPKCDENKMEYEILEAHHKLKQWIGKTVPYFAYPNGSYGIREIEILKKHKFKLAFTTKPYPIKLKETDPFQIPRCEILEHVSLAENICRITGTWIK